MRSLNELKTADMVFIGFELILSVLAVVFESMGWPITPILVPMVAVAIHFSWRASNPSETYKKIDSITDFLQGKIGQAVTELEMLDFYDKLKKDATEVNLVWNLTYRDASTTIEEYLAKEKKSIENNKNLKVRRLIHNELNIKEKLIKHGTELESKGSYRQLFGYPYQNMEIGYSIYQNPRKNNQESRRAIIILADHELHPAVGFFYDDGLPNASAEHNSMISAIKKMYDTEWKICEDKITKN